MERGHADPEATAALDATYYVVLALEPSAEFG